MNRVWNGVFDLPRSSLSPISPLARILVFALFCLVFSACSVGDFLGAYFNTYYNAQRAFTEAEEEVWNQPELKQQGSGRNYLAPFNVSQNAKTKFASVIEKGSKLLEYHPESKLVDDALLMIGKSFFYQSDYPQAERKFKELIDGYPESDLVLEARMLMAYSFYRKGDRAMAVTYAIALLEDAKKEGEDDVIAYTSFLLAQQDVEDKNYNLALGHFLDAADNAPTREQRAYAFLNAAEMYNKMEDYAKAEDAYARATSQSPNYLGEYKGEIGVARMLSKQGKYEESLELLEDLREDTNNKEFYGEIELEIANIYRDRGTLADAVEQYRYVDTAYARTEFSANSYYQLGLLYENVVGLYDSARVAYTKGRTEAGQNSTVAPLLTRRADYMIKHAAFSAEIRKMDSLRIYWLTPRDTVAPAVDSTAQDTSGGKKVGVADSAKAKVPQLPPLPLDSVLTRMASAKSELATLFYTGIGRTDSALYWYRNLITDHPKNPLVPRAIFSIAQIYRQDSTVARSEVDSLYHQLVDQYPQTQYAAEARRELGMAAAIVSPDTAEMLYQQAERAMLAGRNENAIDTLMIIVQAYPTSPFAPRAEYAVGWLYEQVLEQPDSAIANYQRLRAKHPSSTYAASVQPKLVEVEMKVKAAADSAARKAAADSVALNSVRDSVAHKGVRDSVDHRAVADSAGRKQVAPPDSLQDQVIEDEPPPSAPTEGAPTDADSTEIGRRRPPPPNQERRNLE